MKRLLTAALSLILCLSLAACHSPAVESPDPSGQITPSGMPLEIPSAFLGSDPPSNPPVLSADDNSRYFFVNGCFLGGWCGGQWLSAHDTDFTVGKLFNRDYYGFPGEPVGSVRFFIADGPGAFDDPAEAAAQLEPYGIIEGDHFIMKLPGQLIGDAAALTVPNYNFWSYFNGQAYSVISNVDLEQQPLTGSGDHLSDSAVIQVLADAGITCGLSRMDRAAYTSDVDGDGQPETLELIQNSVDESGYAILEEGDQIFYALLLADGDGLTVVASHRIDYTDDVTAHFGAILQNVCDLNGDGSCEIILQQTNWEWGHFSAFSLENGQWTEVLHSEYGM